MASRIPVGKTLFKGRSLTAAIRTSPRFKRMTALATGVVFGAVSLFHPLAEGKGFVFTRVAREEEREREEKERERNPRGKEREREQRHTEVEPAHLRSPFGNSFEFRRAADALRARRSLLDAAGRSTLFRRKTFPDRHKNRQYGSGQYRHK